MKKIKYFICSEEPGLYKALSPVEMDWSESNEEIARAEAYNGEYTIEDDGQPEPEVSLTQEQRIAQLEEALDMLLMGVTE